MSWNAQKQRMTIWQSFHFPTAILIFVVADNNVAAFSLLVFSEWLRAQENQWVNLIYPWLRSKCPPFFFRSASSQHSFWYSYRNHRHVDHFQQKIHEKRVQTWPTKATSLNRTASAKDGWHFPRYLHNVHFTVCILVFCFIVCCYLGHILRWNKPKFEKE